MPITIRNLPAIPGVDPSSLEDDRNRELEAATKQLQSDFPGIRFGELPKPPAPTGGPGAPIEQPVPEQPPLRFTFGSTPQPAPVAPAAKEEPGWWDMIKAGAKIGGKLYESGYQGSVLQIQDEVAKDPEAALNRALSRRDGPGPSLASVLPTKTRERLKAVAEAEKAKTPEQRTAERDATLQKINAINDEIAGLTPQTDSFWKNAALGTSSSLVFMGPSLAAGIATGGATAPLTVAALGTYYVSYAQHRANGASPEKAKSLAAVDGIVEAGTELLPAGALLRKTGLFRKTLETLAADIPGEEVANWIQSTTNELSQLPPDPSDAQIKAAVQAGWDTTKEQAGSVAAISALSGGTMAVTARILGGKEPTEEKPAPKPPGAVGAGRVTPTGGGGGGTAVAGTATPAPVVPPTGGAVAAATAQPAAPAESRLPKPGDAVLFKPSPTMDGAVVEVQQVDPKTRSALVARVDPESGEAITGEDGKPVTFVASFEDLGLNTPPATPIVPKAGTPAPIPVTKPSEVPPAATSAEPTSDIKGQLKDMWRSDTPRRGVYVSPDTVAKMKAEGTYAAATKSGQVEENFDGQGGTVIVKSKKDLEEARAARDGGQTDMQAIIGGLTGAGVAKPNVAKPVTVQRKDETGAVVQQTAVAPEAATATVEQLSKLPGTTEVVTPEAAIAERNQKVEAEKATPPTLEPVTATQEQPPPTPKPKARGPLAQLDDALAFATTAMTTTKGPTSVKIDVRQAANAVGSLAQALRAAISEAQRRGATAEDVKQAADAAKKAERLTEKDEGDFTRSRGVSEIILRQRMAELSDAVASLEKFQDAPLQPVKETKVEKVKRVSKKKEAKVTEPAKEPAAEPAPEPKVDEFPPERYAGAQPWQVEMRNRTDLARVTTVPEDHVAIESFTTERLGEPSMARVAPTSEVTAKIREDIANKVIPENPSFGTLNTAYGLNQSDAAKVQAELKAESKPQVSRAGKKTKYVPPKKRAPTVTQVAEEAGAKVEVAKPDTIELAPSNVTGQEADFVSELLGAGTQELVQEAQMDKTGQLAGTLRQIMGMLNNRGNWTGWFAAVTRGGVMTRDQRNQLFRHIREYAGAEKSELNAAREALLGDVTNIDGKSLPPEAIAAVFEAANVARAYNVIREQLAYEASDANADLQEIEADTQTSGFDTRDMTGEGASLFARRVKGKVLESPERTLQSLLKLPKGKLRESMLKLNKLITQDRWIHGVIAKAMADQQNRGKYGISTHELLDTIVSRAREMGPDQYPFVRVLSMIRKAVPNVPVEFTVRGQPIHDRYGRELSNAAGRWHPEGLMQVTINMTDDGSPLFSVFDLHTIIHEAVHGATMYEVQRNPDGHVAKELRRLRTEITRKAAKKYGAKEIAEVVKFYRGGRTGPKPMLAEKLGNMLYGLTDELELLSETFSNPDFHAFVNSLDQTPTKSWVRERYNALIRAIGRMLGSKTPQDSRILNDLMVTGMRTMEAQIARAKRIQRGYPKAVKEVSELLGLPEEKADALVHAAYTLADIPDDLYNYSRSNVQPPRGTPRHGTMRTWDRTAQSAYVSGPQRLFSEMDAQRTAEWTSKVGRGMRAPESPERLKNHEKLSILAGPRTARALAGVRKLMRSQFVSAVKDNALGVVTTDFLVRRNARLFGSSTDTSNPLVQWKQLRDTRRTFANQLLELAEKTVNSKWMKLNVNESEEIGSVLQDSTLWQIDPEAGAQQPQLIKSISKKRWDAKRQELEARWAKLTDEQKDLYRSVQKYFKTEYSKIRRASMDLAIDLFGAGLTPQQKVLLYALKNPDGVENIIGAGKPIDMGDQNDKFAKVVKDLVRVSAIKGPYFPLFRKGNLVVEAAREGVLQDEHGNGIEFSQKEDAMDAAAEIRTLAPKNTAKVKQVGDKYVVHYKMRHVSFHQSENEAIDEVAKLKSQGFAIEGDTYTRKLESIESASMSEGLRELMNKAESVAMAGGQSEEQAQVVATLQAAFTQILAERAASASTQLKRQGVGGFKGKEAHEIFSRRVRASSWHFANLKTSVAQSKALSRLRTFSRSWEEGGAAVGMTPQQTVLARGRIMAEITRRLRVESEELDSLDRSNLDFYLGQLGFVNFLASPSYAFVNSMQNFNVALPYMAGRYGMKGTRAMIRGMRVVAGPAFAKAMRGLAQRPGDVTSYDVYTAISEAVKQDPRFARFTQPDGNNPSPLQQLVDRGVINASYVQELTSIANNQNLRLTRGLEYLRLLPQGAELWNRISTALAVLDVTNGNVDKAADAVDQVHFQYALENRPRYFRKIGGTRIPQALTMFKMYSVAMYQLTGSLIVDAAGKRGQTVAERREAATALAGIIAAHTLSAGVIGGLMVEPLRFLRELWNQLFGDDDQFSDLDTMVEMWATQVTGSEDAGRLLSKGLWNALGFDLSDRMGLDKILFYSPPEGADEDSFWKFFGQTVGGPIPSMLIQRGTKVYEKAVMQGRPFDAIMEAIPVKLFQDAKKAWEIVHRGVTTRAGETVVPAETFGYLDAVGRMAGFRTTEEVKAQDLASTEFRYKNWRTVRAKQLSNAFWQSYDSGDEAAQAQALAAIRRFNEKNPGAPITAQSLRQSKQQQQKAAQTRAGEGRNPDLNRLLSY